MKRSSSGFTIIEVLIVIVILGILAGIGYVTFTGLQRNSRNNQKETQMTVISKALEDYYEDNGQYPSCDEMSSSTAGDILGIDQSVFVAPGADEPDNNSFIEGCESFSDDGNYYDEFIYDGEGYCSVEGDEDQPCLEYELQYYEEGDSEGPVEITGDEIMDAEEVARYLDCPDGFIPVPGSQKYGTNSFCVMKYEAKNVNGVATSQALIPPWNIENQNEARRLSKLIPNCDDCHLINEAEWMTLVSDIVSVPDNWYDCADQRCIYQGVGNIRIASYTMDGSASDDDEDGYFDIPAPVSTVERRTYKLSTGGTIWDLSGNFGEYTDGVLSTKDFSFNGCDSLCSWDKVSSTSQTSPSPFPGDLAIQSIDNNNAKNIGLGQLLVESANNRDNEPRAMIRGSFSEAGTLRGLMFLQLTHKPSQDTGSPYTGFRAAQ